MRSTDESNDDNDEELNRVEAAAGSEKQTDQDVTSHDVEIDQHDFEVYFKLLMQYDFIIIKNKSRTICFLFSPRLDCDKSRAAVQ